MFTAACRHTQYTGRDVNRVSYIYIDAEHVSLMNALVIMLLMLMMVFVVTATVLVTMIRITAAANSRRAAELIAVFA